MRRSLLFLAGLIITIVSSCSKKPEKEVRILVKTYLDSTLNDNKSYEPIKFGKIDTIYKHWEDDSKEGKDYYKKFETKQAQSDVKQKAIMDYLKSSSSYSEAKYNQLKAQRQPIDDEIMEMAKFIDEKNNNYKGSIKGFIVSHQFRAKNGFGALMLYNGKFSIDSAFTKVLQYREIKEE